MLFAPDQLKPTQFTQTEETITVQTMKTQATQFSQENANKIIQVDLLDEGEKIKRQNPSIIVKVKSSSQHQSNSIKFEQDQQIAAKFNKKFLNFFIFILPPQILKLSH
jgi:hypothetical protein